MNIQEPPACDHPRRGFFRWPPLGIHVAEVCLYCGGIVKRQGHWVNKAELMSRGINRHHLEMFDPHIHILSDPDGSPFLDVFKAASDAEN